MVVPIPKMVGSPISLTRQLYEQLIIRLFVLDRDLAIHVSTLDWTEVRTLNAKTYRRVLDAGRTTNWTDAHTLNVLLFGDVRLDSRGPTWAGTYRWYNELTSPATPAEIIRGTALWHEYQRDQEARHEHK